MSPLPQEFNPRALLPDNPEEWFSQYNRLRSCESGILRRGGPKPDSIAISCIGHLMLHLDDTEAVQDVVNSTKKSLDEKTLVELGEHYIRYFIRLFKRAGGPTPALSTHPSQQEEFEAVRQEIFDELASANLDHRTAKKWALVRDQYRCVASGCMHDGASEDIIENFSRRYRGHVHTLQCSHIIPEGLNNIQGNSNTADETSAMHAVISLFGHSHCFENLNGKNIHRLTNILTLEANMHECFSSLKLWFEPVANADSKSDADRYKYTTRYANSRNEHTVDPNLYGADRVVELGPNGNLPAPSRAYLALHAACCRVAQASGAAEYLEALDRRLEENGVITSLDDLGALNSRLWIVAR